MQSLVVLDAEIFAPEPMDYDLYFIDRFLRI